ncbi:MAG: hypothetical protein O9341_19645 [Paucibacter sp.]|nr:hypothetical protein [Roseateles sp.]
MGIIQMMSVAIVLTTLAALGVLLWASRNGLKLPMPYRERGCQGAGWRQAFPTASKEEIRSFLSLFVDAFAFKAADRLKFNPEERVLDVYRALYPSKWAPDSLEVETLAKALRKTYNIDLGAIWSNATTLGELFSQAHSPSGRGA